MVLKNHANNGSDMYFTVIKNGPYEIVLDSIEGSVYVVAVVEGGIIHKHGNFLSVETNMLIFSLLILGYEL